MYLPHFEYLTPRTVEELVDLLAKHRGNAQILAGGTDLLVNMLKRTLKPAYVIDIQHIDSLRALEFDAEQGLTLGTAVTIEEIVESEVIREHYPALHHGAEVIGSPQVRAMASVGGNSCNASPCADTPPPLIAHGATIDLVSVRGRRQIPLEEFILDNRKVALEPDEFLERFQVPAPRPDSASCYDIIGLRNAVEIDLVSLAVNCAIDRSSGKVEDLRIVMGSVAPTPLRPKRAEREMLGQVPSDYLIDLTAARCAEEARPIDDLRASADYRREAIKGLFKRTFREALKAIN